MPDPTKYERDFSFKGFQTGSPTGMQPGVRIDDELDNIASAIAGLVDAVKNVRRSDGKLPNGIVGPDALSALSRFRLGMPPGDLRFQPDDIEGLDTLFAGVNSQFVDFGTQLAAKATAQQPAAGFSDAETLADFRKRVVAEHINVTDPKWAGGAKVDGVSDDSAAVNAISGYIRARTNKYFSSFNVYIPPGIMQLGASWDISGCHGLNVICAGRDATTIRAAGNFPVIKQTAATVPESIIGFNIGPCNIVGGGMSSTNAHGIVLQAAYEGSIDAKFYSCRDAVQIATSWQFVLKWLRVAGTGTLQNWNGLVQPDGIAGVQENCVIDLGSVYESCANVGIRATACTGSKYISTESTGAGGFAWYIGDSTVGKECKWFLMTACVCDTSPNLLVISRGAATTGVFGQFTIVGQWLGNAQGAGGVALLLQRINYPANVGIAISIDNDTTAIILQSKDLTVDWGSAEGYDRFQRGNVGVLVEDSTDNAFRFSRIKPTNAAVAGAAIIETGTSARNTFVGFNAEKAVTLIPGNGSGKMGRAGGQLFGLVNS
ncbi:hypothetical protein ASG63_22955 [Methylobacterium sp. Leaf94]|nr:hypothetical protein ASG63_22955 [Methylobacterium sp. Leaf94]